MRILIYVPPAWHQIIFWNTVMHMRTTAPQAALPEITLPPPTRTSSHPQDIPPPSPAMATAPHGQDATDLQSFVQLLARTEARRIHRRSLGMGLPATALLLIAAALALAIIQMALHGRFGGMGW